MDGLVEGRDVLGVDGLVDGRVLGVDGRVDGADGLVDGVEGRVLGADGRVDGVVGRLAPGVDGRVEGRVASPRSGTPLVLDHEPWSRRSQLPSLFRRYTLPLRSV